jgi:hypothetical protein
MEQYFLTTNLSGIDYYVNRIHLYSVKFYPEYSPTKQFGTIFSQEDAFEKQRKGSFAHFFRNSFLGALMEYVSKQLTTSGTCPALILNQTDLFHVVVNRFSKEFFDTVNDEIKHYNSNIDNDLTIPTLDDLQIVFESQLTSLISKTSYKNYFPHKECFDLFLYTISNWNVESVSLEDILTCFIINRLNFMKIEVDITTNKVSMYKTSATPELLNLRKSIQNAWEVLLRL